MERYWRSGTPDCRNVIRVPPFVRASENVARECTPFGQSLSRQDCTMRLSFVSAICSPERPAPYALQASPGRRPIFARSPMSLPCRLESSSDSYTSWGVAPRIVAVWRMVFIRRLSWTDDATDALAPRRGRAGRRGGRGPRRRGRSRADPERAARDVPADRRPSQDRRARRRRARRRARGKLDGRGRPDRRGDRARPASGGPALRTAGLSLARRDLASRRRRPPRPDRRPHRGRRRERPGRLRLRGGRRARDLPAVGCAGRLVRRPRGRRPRAHQRCSGEPRRHRPRRRRGALMATLEVRRHAERSDRGNEKSALSANGRAMAQGLAQARDAYALVVSSPLPRARETALLIAGRLDAADPALLPEMGGAIGDRLYGEMRTLADWRRLLDERDEARHVADEQLAAWTRLASRVGDGERVLAVSHGRLIELPALVLAERLRAPLAGAAFGYCEGVRVEYAKGAATKIAVLRL